MNNSPTINQSQSHRTPVPVTPRRPSTSSGADRIEPTSVFLIEALRGRPSLPERARSTTPRRIRPNRPNHHLRPSAYKDEWLQSSGDDEPVHKPKIPQRPIRARRASDVSAGVCKSSPSVSVASSSSSRALEAKVDQLQKENWDLKHRLTLYQERAKKMNNDLGAKDTEIERLLRLEQTNQHLESHIISMKDTNQELTIINEELVFELDKYTRQLEVLEKDAVGRQSAIEEAAAIIQSLEAQLYSMETKIVTLQHNALPATNNNNHTGSDYYSADGRAPHFGSKNSPSLSNTPLLLPDSDYFSADISPITPTSTTLEKPSPAQIRSLKEKSVVFNRELGIQSVTSTDSLLSVFLHSPNLPAKTTPSSASSGISRLNRLRALTKRSDVGKNILSRSTGDSGKPKSSSSQSWFSAKPLRNLYMMTSDAKKSYPPNQSDTSTTTYPEMDSEGKAQSNPSIAEALHLEETPVTVHETSDLTRSNNVNARPHHFFTRPTSVVKDSTPTIPRKSFSMRTALSPHNLLSLTTQRPSNTTTATPATVLIEAPSSSSPRTALPSQLAPIFSDIKPTTNIHRTAPPPSLTYWPLRYPAWPPSASLRDRELLFHGGIEGMDDWSDQSPIDCRTELPHGAA